MRFCFWASHQEPLDCIFFLSQPLRWKMPNALGERQKMEWKRTDAISFGCVFPNRCFLPSDAAIADFGRAGLSFCGPNLAFSTPVSYRSLYRCQDAGRPFELPATEKIPRSPNQLFQRFSAPISVRCRFYPPWRLRRTASTSCKSTPLAASKTR